jgi:hypothetical protein
MVGVGLRRNAIGAAQQVEVVDESRAQIDLQGFEHAFGRNPDQVGLAPVDIGIDARRADIEQGIDLSQSLVGIGLGNQRLCLALSAS